MRPAAALVLIAFALRAAPAFPQAADAPARDDAGTSVELAPARPAQPPPAAVAPAPHLEVARPTHWYWGWLIAGLGAAATVGVGAGAASCSSATCSRNLLAVLTTLIAGELLGGGYAVVAALR